MTETKTKRPRSASPDITTATQKRFKGGEAGPSSSEQVAALNILARLPSEVVERILEHACFSPPLPTPNASASSQALTRRKPFIPHVAYDGKTAFSLLTTSRSLYAIVAGLLYSDVCLTRPSSLALFCQALKDSPELREKVKRINIGPQHKLPEQWWPIVRGTGAGASKCIALGLQGDELDELPLSLPWLRRWATGGEGPSCAQRFILDGISPSHKALVQQLDRLHDSTPSEMREWLISIFDTQAKLDLYALELRRVEDERRSFPACDHGSSGCAAGNCRHYPTVVISETSGRVTRSTSRAQMAESNFFLPVASLRAHQARRGSLTDRFDHPLLFARSELSVCGVNAEGKPELDYNEVAGDLAKQGFRETMEPSANSYKRVVALIVALKELTGLDDSQLRIWPEVLAEGVRIREEFLLQPEEEKGEESEEDEAGGKGGQSEQEEGGSKEEEDDGLLLDAVDTEDEGVITLNSLP